MYCRKCIKKTQKKINMIVDVNHCRYICPICHNRVEWLKHDIGEMHII